LAAASFAKATRLAALMSHRSAMAPDARAPAQPSRLASPRRAGPAQLDPAADRRAIEVLAPLVELAATGALPSPVASAEATRAAATLADRVAPALWFELLTPALCSKHAPAALQWLRDTAVLAVVLPELDATVALAQEGGRAHKDVWEHTKQVVKQAVPRPTIRWAAALHDIGKVPTRRFVAGGKVTFHGHAEEGVRMFRRGPARRIGFPPAMRDRIELLILHHLRPGQYASDWTDSAIRRFARELGEGLDDLLLLSRADVTSRRPGQRKRCLARISELARKIRALQAADDVPRPLPPGLGLELMRALELPPGKHLAVLRERLEALCLAGEIDGGETPAYYVDVIHQHGLLAGLELRPARRGGLAGGAARAEPPGEGSPPAGGGDAP
jgi:poly(A) polymerase